MKYGFIAAALFVLSLICAGIACQAVQELDEKTLGTMKWKFSTSNFYPIECRFVHELCVCQNSPDAGFQIVDKQMCIPSKDE